MSLKDHVEQWLRDNKITNCSVRGLGKGHHGVQLFFHDETYDDFVTKHGSSFVTKHYKGYLSKLQYTEFQAYISIVKNKDR